MCQRFLLKYVLFIILFTSVFEVVNNFRLIQDKEKVVKIKYAKDEYTAPSEKTFKRIVEAIERIEPPVKKIEDVEAKIKLKIQKKAEIITPIFKLTNITKESNGVGNIEILKNISVTQRDKSKRIIANIVSNKISENKTSNTEKPLKKSKPKLEEKVVEKPVIPEKQTPVISVTKPLKKDVADKQTPVISVSKPLKKDVAEKQIPVIPISKPLKKVEEYKISENYTVQNITTRKTKVVQADVHVPEISKKIQVETISKIRPEPVLKLNKTVPVIKKDKVTPKVKSEPKEIVKKKDDKKPVVKKVKDKIEVKRKNETSKAANKKKTSSTKVLSSIELSFQMYFPNFKKAKSDTCRKHGEILTSQYQERKLWAMKMLDSSAKIPSNILKGNLNQLGDFDECLSVSAKINNENDTTSITKIFGKYCLVSIDLQSKIRTMTLPVNLAQGRTFLTSRSQDPGHFIPRFSTLKWGICIPSGCNAEDVRNIMEDYVESSNIKSHGIDINIATDPDQCQVRKQVTATDYEYRTILTIIFFIFIISITTVSTIQDYMASNNEKNSEDGNEKSQSMLMPFSLKQNFTSLLEITEADEIKCIHGIRAISTLLLYVAHKLIPIGHTPFINRIHLTEISNNPLSIILRLSVVYTDTFLFLSGVLTAYHMSKDIEKRGHIPWIKRLISRMIRLLPSVMVVLLIYSNVIEHVGNGPLWNTVVTKNSNLCKEHWWKNILFIQNLFPFETMCATHTHQIALDMQLYLIAPALVWILYKKTFLGITLLVILHFLSTILRYYTTIHYRLSLVIYHGISLSQLYRTANYLYASSLHRATPYISGIALGVLLRQTKPNSPIPKVISIIGWLLTTYLVFWMFYSPSHLSRRDYQYDSHEAGHYAALCSFVWSFALSWIIYSCSSNHAGHLNQVLGSKSMVLLSKLSYSLYLVQFLVFFYNVGTIRTPLEFNIASIVNIPEFLTILLASLILFVTVEQPSQKLKTILMRS